MKRVLRNCLVLGEDLSLEKKDLYVDGDRFSGFVEGETENLDGMVVIPGLVNTHTHAAMTLFRGLAGDVTLEEWLNGYIFPREDKLTEEDVYTGSLLGFMEMLKNGITTFFDMYVFPDAVAQAAKDLGIRGVIVRGLADIDGRGAQKLDESERFVKSHLDDPAIRGGFGPHALYTCSKDYFEQVVKLSDRYSAPLTFHLLESPSERKDFKDRNGTESVDFLDSIGAFGERTVVAHGTHLNSAELELLAKRKTTLAYNPISNAKLGNGIAPIAEALEKKVNVTLGTDSAASNDSLNLFDEIKFGTLLQRAVGRDPTLLKAKQIFSMATVNSSAALPFDIGSVKEGKLADLVVIDPQRISMLPTEKILSHLIYSFDTSAISRVMVGGRWIYENGGFSTVDQERVMEKFEKTVKDLDSRI